MGLPLRPRAKALPKTARVRTRRDFLTIQRLGRRSVTRHFLVVHTRNASGPARIGITVTRKIGGAVARNRVKRAVREAFREVRESLPAGLSVVVIARTGAPALDTRSTANELCPAFSELRSPDLSPSGAAG